MNSIILLVFPIGILVLTFWGAQIYKSETSPTFLTLEQSKMIQGASCLCIILHHLVQAVTGYGVRSIGLTTVFNYIGFYFTAIFFFFSGYGLLTSHLQKEDYLNKFLQKRLPKVLIPFWIVNLILVAISIIGYGDRKSTGIVLREIFGLRLINSNGWFIVEIILFYLAFFILFSLIKKKDIALGILCVFVLFVIRFAFFRGHDLEGNKISYFRGEWWYNSTVVFIFGLLYARFREKIDLFCQKFYYALLALFAALSIAGIHFSTFAVKRYGYYHTNLAYGYREALYTLVVQSISCLFFTMFVLLLNMRIRLTNRVIKYVGSISLTLFLVHGYLVNRILSNVRMSDFVRFLVVFIVSIACAAMISPLSNALVKRTIDILTYEKKINDTLEGAELKKQMQKRNRLLKRLAIVLLLVAVAGGFYATVGRKAMLEKEFAEEKEALLEAKVGDIVNFGRFDTDARIPGAERVFWIVVKIEGDKICLLSEKGIAGSEYYKKHEEVTWADSYLRNRLNSEEFLKMFSSMEKEVVLPVDGDEISLLTVDEAMEIFGSDKERELDVTEVAILDGTNVNGMSKANNWDMKGYRSSWWWLKGNCENASIYAPIVTVDGIIETDKKVVNKPNGAIRPVIWVSVDKF